MLIAGAARKVTGKRVLKLVRSYLNAGVTREGVAVEKHEGTLQRGPLSPLLSNIVLDDLDKELTNVVISMFVTRMIVISTANQRERQKESMTV